MATEKQIAANRRNARKSTGPTTASGKAASSRNALRHGVLSEKAVSEFEERKQFDALLQGLVADLIPVTTIECMLVERLTILLWREKRLIEAEERDITRHIRRSETDYHYRNNRDVPFNMQHLIGRYQGLLARQMRDTLRDLHDQQQRRLMELEEASPSRGDAGK